MLVALFAALVGAFAGAYLTKLWTPNPTEAIASLRKDLANVQQQLVSIEQGRALQKQNDTRWAERFESAAKQVVDIGPVLMVPDPGCNSVTLLFGLVFPESELRTRIQNSIVQLDSPTMFSIRAYSDEQLRRSAVRQTIDDVLSAIELFREKQPRLAAQYLSRAR